MTTDNRTNEPTAEQIVSEALGPYGLIGRARDLAARNAVERLRTHGLLSEVRRQAAEEALLKAEALEEFAGQMATGFNPQTLNAERRAIKREARARAAEYKKAEG